MCQYVLFQMFHRLGLGWFIFDRSIRGVVLCQSGGRVCWYVGVKIVTPSYQVCWYCSVVEHYVFLIEINDLSHFKIALFHSQFFTFGGAPFFRIRRFSRDLEISSCQPTKSTLPAGLFSVLWNIIISIRVCECLCMFVPVIVPSHTCILIYRLTQTIMYQDDLPRLEQYKVKNSPFIPELLSRTISYVATP